MTDTQQQLDPNDPVAIRFRQLRGDTTMPAQTMPGDGQLDPNDPIAVRFQQLKGGQTATPPPAPAPVGGLDPNDPIAIRFRQLRGEPQASTSDDESDRMGEGQSWVTKPLTTSLLGWGEYRQGATGIEKGAEKFASGLLSPLSVGLMVITGGLGGIAEAGAATAGEEAVTSLAGRAGESLLSSLSPEVAAKVATASGIASKLANAGFTGQQIVTLAEQAPQFKDALASGDYDKAEELGTSMLLGGTLAALSTAHLVKSVSPGNEPIWTQDKEVIAASQQPVREAGARALEFRKANEALIRNKPLDMAAQLYHEAGGDSDVLERWRQEVVDDNNIVPAIQQKYDFLLWQAQNLPAEVQQLSAQLRLDYAQDLEELKRAGKYDPAKPGDNNYAGQHQYVPDDEGASGLKAPGSSVRRLTKSPALTKPRSFDTIVEALKAGYEPKDIGLAGAREIYIRDLGGMRGALNAEKEVLGQTADDNRPVAIDPARIRIINGKEVIPVEPGSKVGDVAGQRAPAASEVSGTVRPEDVLRRVAGTGDIKTAVFKEGASDLEIQTLRDAYAAGADIKPVEVTLDKDGNVIDSDGLHRAYAAQQAGVERVPYIVRRLADERDANVNPVPGKWPDEIDPITDKEIIGRAVAQVTGRANDTFDDLDAKTQGRVIRRALDMKVAEKTQNSPTATAVRKPSLQPTPKVIVKNGKMYWDVSDYKSGPDVFNRFRFRATDQNGDPVFERANVKVHPDYHEPIMQAFQDTSWFRKNPIARLALGSSVQAKKLLLSFSPFHWTTEYLRGVQMGLTPIEALNPKELTPDRLAVRSKYGPTLGVEDQRALAAEGAAGSSPLLHKLPLGVGKFLAASEEKLFGGGGYIDRLKADTFDKVTAQIGQRHPNWSTDQVHFASSKIVDSAFGGLNWKMLGASMNSVDALRLIALAPDFTGSQILFAKYGMQPGGSVVGQSLMRIALYNFGVARVLNLLTTGQLHAEHPFAVVSPDEKKLFSIRTMPQDILHALTDPRQFTYNRMNPLLVRGAIEGITGKDEQGKQVTYQKELHDLFRNVLPISSQNFIPGFRREGEGIGSQVLRGAGLTSEPNTTTAFKLAAQLASNRGESGPVDQDKLDRHQYVIQMEDSLRAGAAGIGDLNTAIEHDLLSKDEVKQIAENFKVTQGMSDYDARLYTRASRLPIKDALEVYDVATPQEKKMLLPLLQKKGTAFLKKAQDSMTATARANDPIYQRLRRALPSAQLW